MHIRNNRIRMLLFVRTCNTFKVICPLEKLISHQFPKRYVTEKSDIVEKGRCVSKD